jgi:tRNA nucleotidyltransferase (CCA-adding enzyme)
VAADQIDTPALEARISALPGVERLREAAAGTKPHLVGGAVRDLLRGDERADVDVVVEGDAIEVARRLSDDPVLHERFGTATVSLDGLTVDLAGARAEAYPAPGALPEVRPGDLADDLARRDFTVNAMAVPLDGPAVLVDPHGGAGDLEAGLLRVLHSGSFADDPTRALRAARYGARLGLTPEPETERLLRAADLTTVSEQRVEAELRRIAAEPDPAAVVSLARGWGLLDLDDERTGLVDAALGTLAASPWAGVTSAGDVLVAIVSGDLAPARELASSSPDTPAAGVAAAHGHDATTLLVARALGAEWLDHYLDSWRDVRLEISGNDLLAEGVEEGPAIGRGLEAALRAKLNGEAAGRVSELEIALAAARAG